MHKCYIQTNVNHTTRNSEAHLTTQLSDHGASLAANHLEWCVSWSKRMLVVTY